MRLRAISIAVAVITSVVVVFPAVAQKPAADRLADLKAQFEWHRNNLGGAQKAFEEKYAVELKKLEEKGIAEGNLELVLAVRKEKEEFSGRKKVVTPSPLEDLANLQFFYEGQSSRIASETASKMEEFVTAYRKQLDDLRDELTQANAISSAVAVQAELTKLGEEFPTAKPAAPVAPSGTPAPPKGNPGDMLRAFRSKVKGLLVIQLEGSEFAGKASNLSASAIPVDGTKEATVTFNQEVGDSMKKALAEVIKFHKVRYQGWPKGKRIEISFEDKYSPKDGPSAAVACALLLESLLSGNPLDEMFAVTGDMNADGSVQPIGGVSAKIRGATRRTCSVVAIPKKNERALFDLVLTEGITPLMEIQVFTISTFDQALALAKMERNPVVQTSLDEFAAIQEVFGRPGANPGALLRVPSVQQKLQGILKGTPNHLSALIMLAASRGNLPKTLSLVGSLNAIDNTSAAMLRLIKSGAVDSGSIDRLAGDELADTITRLRRFRSILDRRTWPYSDAIVDLGGFLRTWKDNRPGDPARRNALYNDIKRASSNVDRQMKALSSNREIMEELIR